MAGRSSTSVMLLVSLFLLLAFSHVAEAYKTLPQSACTPRCKNRCSATSHKKPCMFFCEKCCAKCKCVPPGVVGNKQMCPCYNNWKTQEGRPKCP